MKNPLLEFLVRQLLTESHQSVDQRFVSPSATTLFRARFPGPWCYRGCSEVTKREQFATDFGATSRTGSSICFVTVSGEALHVIVTKATQRGPLSGIALWDMWPDAQTLVNLTVSPLGAVDRCRVPATPEGPFVTVEMLPSLLEECHCSRVVKPPVTRRSGRGLDISPTNPRIALALRLPDSADGDSSMSDVV